MRPRRARARPSPPTGAPRRGVRRLVRCSDLCRDPNAVRDDADVARSERAGVLGERGRGDDDYAGAADEKTRKRSRPPREHDVGAPELKHERLSRRERREHRRQPVRVHDVGVAGGSARRARKPEEEERQGEELPRRRAEVVHDPVAVGDPVVAEVGGRDDAHLEPGARRASTPSRTKVPATSSASRGYDVVRTVTLTGAFRGGARAPPEPRSRAARARRSSRRTSSGRRCSRPSSRRWRRSGPAERADPRCERVTCGGERPTHPPRQRGPSEEVDEERREDEHPDGRTRRTTRRRTSAARSSSSQSGTRSRRRTC